MDWFNVIVMAIGLAMDCCAVSVVQGLNQRTWHWRALLMAFIFGAFHCCMPIIGFYAGELATEFMRRYAPWIALILLTGLGVKMIWESLHEHQQDSVHFALLSDKDYSCLLCFGTHDAFCSWYLQ